MIVTAKAAVEVRQSLTDRSETGLQAHAGHAPSVPVGYSVCSTSAAYQYLSKLSAGSSWQTPPVPPQTFEVAWAALK